MSMTRRKSTRSVQAKAPRPTLARFRRILRRHLPELQATYGVQALWLFGSYVRGEARKRSDLDVLVEFIEAPSLFRYIELEQHLSQLVGVKVDLVMKRALKPVLGARILSEVVMI